MSLCRFACVYLLACISFHVVGLSGLRRVVWVDVCVYVYMRNVCMCVRACSIVYICDFLFVFGVLTMCIYP